LEQEEMKSMLAKFEEYEERLDTVNKENVTLKSHLDEKEE
jgi:cell shape-determining protein MreC